MVSALPLTAFLTTTLTRFHNLSTCRTGTRLEVAVLPFTRLVVSNLVNLIWYLIYNAFIAGSSGYKLAY